MENPSSAELDLLRSDSASLQQRPGTPYVDGAASPEQATIADLVRASIVLESITDAFFGLDDHWNFAYLNREAERLLGRSREDLVGKNVWVEFAPAVGSTFYIEYHRALRERTAVHFEEYYLPLETWFEVRAYPLKDGLAVYFQNVNERKRTERELARQEAQLRTIIDSVPVIVSSIGPDGRFRELSRRFEDLFGRSAESAIGRTLSEVAGEPHISIARPYLERAMKGEKLTFNSIVRSHTGDLRDVRVFYNPQYSPDGEFDGIIAMVEDVTEQVRAESAVRHSEARFRSVFDVAASGMAIFSVPDGTIQRVNARFAEILGYEQTEMAGLSYVHFTHPDDVEESTRRLRSLLAGSPGSYQIDRRYVRKDGAVVWGQSSVALIRDALGHPVELVLVVEDITDRKLSEEALRESENRFRTMAESLPQLVWTCLPDGQCDYLSAQWVAYTGIPEEDQLKLGWADLVLHPDDRDRTLAAWTAAVRDEAAYDLEYRIRRYDGQYRWFKTRGTPVRDAAGRIVRWFGTCTDINDQREAEEERLRLLEREQRARALAEVLNGVGPMLLTELDTKRLVEKVTELTTELTGAQFGAFVHQVTDQEGDKRLLITVAGSPEASSWEDRNFNFSPSLAGAQAVLSSDIQTDSRFQANTPFFGVPGCELPFRSFLAAPVESRAGHLIGALLFGHADTAMFAEPHAQLVHGITAQAFIALDNARLFAEVQRSEAALRSSNAELRQANADLEQFAYAAAHDLQEPLRMVTSYTQLLERTLVDRLDERTRGLMAFIVGGATRMSLLLQDLLAYTEMSRRLDSGERVCLGRALQQVIRNLQAAINETGATIRHSELPCVRGRESQFVQLLQNLISNAIKYRRPEVAPEIDITAERSGDMWVVRVRDNGIGIDPAYHRQVFGVFKRLHGSDIPGTGIGLAICQRVIERAGGEIWVESKLGEGSTFAFSLPVVS